MSFKDKYPDFAAIEGHIRRAQAERSVAIATFLAEVIMATVNGVKRVATGFDKNLAAERDRRAIQSDAFLKRSVPRY